MNKVLGSLSGSFINTVNLILLFFLFTSYTYGQELNGQYTIGGDSADFSSFNDAIDSLELNGISGEVNFNVRPGIYYEQIKIDSIKGEGTITFESETGNRHDVVLRHIHKDYWDAVNYTIHINGAENIVFKNLSIRADPEEYISDDNNRVLLITRSRNITFINTELRSWHVSYGYLQYNNCIFVTEDSEDINFINNTIIGGYRGIEIKGNYASKTNASFRFISNTFIDQENASLLLYDLLDIEIRNNSFYSSKNSGLYSAINIYRHFNNLLIDRNEINLKNSGIGILVGLGETNGKSKNIVNNQIAIGTLNSNIGATGIKSYKNDSLLIAYNSINIYDSTSTSSCINSTDQDTLQLINNNFRNVGGIIYNSETDLIKGRNNNLYTPQNIIATINNIEYFFLSDIQASLNSEFNSLSVDPLFQDKEILKAFAPEIYNAGIPLAEIQVDFYGNLRSSTAPDIGSIEGNFTSLDAAFVNISVSDSISCLEDSLIVSAFIKNLGSDTINSFNISVESDDQLIETLWTGTLFTGETEQVYVGKLFSTKSMQEKHIKAWLSEVNGASSEAFFNNDTLQSYYKTALFGRYTIGDSTADFTNINEAIYFLNEFGVCGSVSLELLPGVYQEKISIPNIAGVSENSNLTLTSSNLDSLATLKLYGPSSYILQLAGANNIKIEKLNFNGGYNPAIKLVGASGNKIVNNKFASSSNSSTNAINIISSSKEFSRNNLISNNSFDYTNIVINGFEGNSLETEISNNNFIVNGPAISISNERKVKILNNHFQGKNGSREVIRLSNCYEDIQVEKNVILINDGHSFNSRVTFSMADCEDVNIFNNFFYTNNQGSIGSNVSIVNNKNIRFYHNTMYSVTNDPGFKLISNDNIRVINNIIHQDREGMNYRLYKNSNLTSNYNGFYSKVTKNSFHMDESELDLEAYKFTTKLDSNSVIAYPLFQDTLDLHIDNSAILNNSGYYLSEVTEDIDGDVRSSIPDIGADEFFLDSTTYYDLRLSSILKPTKNCEAPDSLKVMVVNESDFPLDSFYVYIYLFERVYDSTLIVNSIASKDSIVVNLGAFPFVPKTYYQFRFEIKPASGFRDHYFNDNFQKYPYSYLADINIYINKNPVCNSLTELYIKNIPHSRILWSTGDNGQKINVSDPGEYSVEVYDENGCLVSNIILVE